MLTRVVRSLSPSSANAVAAIRSTSGSEGKHLSESDHAIDGSARPAGGLRRNGDVIAIERQGVAHARKGDRLHEGTHRLGIGRDELLLRSHLLHPVHDSGL